jgi:hypothetical protein
MRVDSIVIHSVQSARASKSIAHKDATQKTLSKMSVGKDTIDTMKTTLKEYYILTGELVKIVAEDEEMAFELLGDGVYEEVETLSELQSVIELDEEYDVEE